MILHWNLFIIIYFISRNAVGKVYKFIRKSSKFHFLLCLQTSAFMHSFVYYINMETFIKTTTLCSMFKNIYSLVFLLLQIELALLYHQLYNLIKCLNIPLTERNNISNYQPISELNWAPQCINITVINSAHNIGHFKSLLCIRTNPVPKLTNGIFYLLSVSTQEPSSYLIMYRILFRPYFFQGYWKYIFLNIFSS